MSQINLGSSDRPNIWNIEIRRITPMEEIKDLAKRVWNAVVKFFAYVYTAIKNSCCCQTGAVFQNMPVARTLEEKLAPYQNMPLEDDTRFLFRSIEIARSVLQRKDEILTEDLLQVLRVNRDQLTQMMSVGQKAFTEQMGKRQPPIDSKKLPYQLATFDEEFKDMDAESFPKVLEAVIRAYVFSNEVYNMPNYLKHREPNPHQNRGTIDVDYRPEIARLKNIFNPSRGAPRLSDDEKQIIIDAFGSEPSELPLSELGKGILTDIRTYSSKLHQNNRDFILAFQSVYERVCPHHS